MNQQVMPPRASRNALADMMNDLGFAQPPRISTEGKRFSIVDAAGNATLASFIDQQCGYYLDVIIAYANNNKSKIYWGNREYVRGNTDPPTCFSDNGLAPSMNASEPQSLTCASCPHNELGSAISRITNKKVRACADRKKLAVFVVGWHTGELFQLNIAPDSLANLRAYGGWLKQNGKDTADLITRVFFDPEKENALSFFAVGPTPDGYYALLDENDTSQAWLAIVGADDQPRPIDRPLALPAAQPQQHLPAPPGPGQYVGQQPQGFQQPAPQPSYPPPHQFQQAPQGVQQSAPQPQGFQNPVQQAPQGVQQQQPVAANPPAPKSGRGGSRRGAGRPAAAPAPEQQAQPQTQPQQAPQGNFAPAPQQAPGPAPFEMRRAPDLGPAPQPGQQPVPGFLQRDPNNGFTQPGPMPGPAQGFGPAPQPGSQPGPQPGPAPQGGHTQNFGMSMAPGPDPRTQAALNDAFNYQPPAGGPPRA